MLGFIETLDQPQIFGVNPEVAHEQMAGLNFMHGVAQAWEAGKLFHIDLNDQNFARYDQDLRFGSHNLKQAFFLVKFLEDVGYNAPRHYDAHAYRTEDIEGVKDFARGCMRTYLILKEKAARWNADKEIQAILKDINLTSTKGPGVGKFSKKGSAALLGHSFDKDAMAAKRLPYELLDQLTVDIFVGRSIGYPNFRPARLGFAWAFLFLAHSAVPAGSVFFLLSRHCRAGLSRSVASRLASWLQVIHFLSR